jgi:SAM-dependent methyltransferase
MNIRELLIELEICTADSIELYHHRVRDRDDLPVYKCKKSGVIFLGESTHIESSYYASMDDLHYWNASNRQQVLAGQREDTVRRAREFEAYISGKHWVDIGTGIGGILDELAHTALSTKAVEPQQAARTLMQSQGYEVLASTDLLNNESADTVTLFHVLEHFTDPVHELKTILQKTKPGGRLIVEVPHAADFLLSFLGSEPFKNFTLWSEHIILHTRHSLTTLMKHCGWQVDFCYGVQRYPLANHLHWLVKNKPGGHQKWAALRTDELDEAYAAMLAKIDMTDTLICIASKPDNSLR